MKIPINIFLTTLFVCAQLLFSPYQALSKDITAKVIRDTELDERISLFCTMYCFGNRKEGSLKSITIEETQDDQYKVYGKAALRNRQITGDYTLYDRTILVNSRGKLKPESCELRVEDVWVENDFQNLVTNLIKSNSDIIGKVVIVPDCKSFLN